jgi:hypothetical protein
MPMPDLMMIAQCHAPEGPGYAGERWYLRVGGSAADYYTLLETVHPDGHRDEGGMGGPVLYPGRLLNVYTGRADRGFLRVVVRADPRVQRLCLQSEQGERCDLRPVGDDTDLGVVFFAVLLPWTTDVLSMQALDADGQVLRS